MAARRNRYWIGFFVIVLLLTGGAITWLITFNLGQQLKPEQLEAARRRWDKHGRADYDLAYTQKRQDQNGSVEEHFTLKVRRGRVVYGSFRTSPTFQETGLQSRLYSLHNIPRFFDYLEDYLKEDAKPNARRTFMVAVFDPEDGHLVHLIRRVSGTANRVEITVNEYKEPSPTALTAAALDEARGRWDRRKPTLRDYKMAYTLRQGPDDPGIGYAVALREGEFVSAKREDKAVTAETPHVYDMATLFARIVEWQREDEAAGRPPADAIFDPTTGQVRWYSRRPAGGPEVELFVDPVEPLPLPAR